MSAEVAANPEYLTPEAIHSFIRMALAEDVGEGDHSTLACIPANANKSAFIMAKSAGIVAGVQMAREIFNYLSPDFKIQIHCPDGSIVEAGSKLLSIEGPAGFILTGERLALNCLQRMSGIATYTQELNKLIAHTKAKLLDTRKTTPLFRLAEKWAVAIGGGVNHRFGLYDMIMLKDNHIEFAGGITPALNAVEKYLSQSGKSLGVVVETRNLAEVQEVLDYGKVTRILLDNMAPAMLRQAVQLIAGRIPTEASGGITEATIAEVAETGVDFISVGALTHSYRSLDISLYAE